MMACVTHLRTDIQSCINDSRAGAHRCSRLRCTMLTLTLSLGDVHSSLTLSGCVKQLLKHQFCGLEQKSAFSFLCMPRLREGTAAAGSAVSQSTSRLSRQQRTVKQL